MILYTLAYERHTFIVKRMNVGIQKNMKSCFLRMNDLFSRPDGLSKRSFILENQLFIVFCIPTFILFTMNVEKVHFRLVFVMTYNMILDELIMDDKTIGHYLLFIY